MTQHRHAECASAVATGWRTGRCTTAQLCIGETYRLHENICSSIIEPGRWLRLRLCACAQLWGRPPDAFLGTRSTAMVYLLLTQPGGWQEKSTELVARQAARSPHGVQWTMSARAPTGVLPLQAMLSRRGGRVRAGGEESRRDTRGPLTGHERSWLVKTVTTTASIQPMTVAAEQPLSPPAPRTDEEAQPGEAFEATILRLDGTTLERLLKLAGE